ncbi:MAG: 3-dehydroquinate synthase [Candidatus Marinimicrobia bacterium]|nr:3-dehydroquinate synthase [Candidatus Neomarinimicrobiota bacterium]MCF7850250.1 3-dehydroquinate synthase [Candidatus Neomarinimicrobiota bacterium]MCF7903708.1 3-dehydroquinate synthase [Candidatus Neomarinimicrobiota bacterium]
MSETTRIKIKHEIGQYECLIGGELISNAAEHLKAIEAAGPIGIISNNTVNELYGTLLRDSLQAAGFVTRTILIPEGEAYKNLATVEQVMDALIAQGMERTGTIVTLGGGVTTDLGGFVAAILFRGIKLVHIPTTLLSMVDAAVGGKTGVNHKSGKNLIGSFYQPDLVLMDVHSLASLDERDRISGYAEMFKMGAVCDLDYFNFLTENMHELLASEPNDKLIQAISKSCELKAEVVEADEKEAGLRRILNFGHTLGHAIEAKLGYGKIRHGEAVILGMYGAGWLSNQAGDLPDAEWQVLADNLRHIPLKTPPGELDPAEIEAITHLDKKVAHSELHWVLLSKLGQHDIRSGIPTVMVRLAVEAINKAWQGREA